ncbi:GSCFA domain-containing protein [Hymenobacter tibetensis]|uniref:GSCFA domain-containing protein n=1 Tax=Hymenobacter tibetensis TaxID=497967 RepID=A0ABY4CUT4_9BACT|nr:GSCFA domain-containing protein [Hymenobacter tibetensis]UOG73861.1 GSCFA domain-containing protein [Hymenobacter tibetensis]
MFRTELPFTPIPHQLPLSARVLTIGSCFSDTIGSRLEATKVHTLTNPFGTVFNPLSACKLLRAAAGEDTDWQQHLVEARGRWQSYDLHAKLGADSPVELLQTLQQQLRDTGVFLATADVVVITLGSAWAYRLKETDEFVSNCHKMPAEKFTKELLTPDEVINAIAETHAYLRLRNPKLQFVLTVSPVRHLKDTLPLNAVSKSVLRVACHYLSELLPDVSYFPAYELLLDDLRDYRFYAADMLHPSPVAEDYIWERFARTYFDVEFGRFRKEWDAVRQALNHRPLYPVAPEHRQFLTSTLEKLEKLAGQADMRMEILDVRRQLQNLPAPKPEPVPESEEEDDDEERIDVGETLTSAPTPLPEHTILLDAVVETVEVEPNATEPLSEAETLVETMEEVAQPKKRRRSRGGAKRNKKKHAARLAEEAAAQAIGAEPVAEDVSQVESEPVAEVVVFEEIASPNVTLTFNPDAPLQTAMERRKRNSRRGRGRKQSNETPTDGLGDQTAENSLPANAEPIALLTPDEPETIEATVPAEPQLPATEQESSAAAVVDEQPSVNVQRPVRTGRSASEVRAAALRKPRRPDSRIKTLYATPVDTASAPVEPSVPEPETTATTPEPVTPVAESSVIVTAPTDSVPVQDTVEPTRLPVVSAIPPVKGTGASGRLSASGQATLNTKPDRIRPAIVAPVTPAAEESISQAVPTEATPAATTELPPAAAVEPNDSAAHETETTPALSTPTPKRPARKPASPKPQKAVAATEQLPTATSQPDKGNPKAKKKPAAPVEAPAPAQAPDPAEETAAASKPPVARRRKPDTKPADSTTAPPVATPKRAPRPPRRKPAAPDEPSDAS